MFKYFKSVFKDGSFLTMQLLECQPCYLAEMTSQEDVRKRQHLPHSMFFPTLLIMLRAMNHYTAAEGCFVEKKELRFIDSLK